MTTLALSDEHAHLGKIANNLEFAGEAEAVITGFTLPLDLQVPRSQLMASATSSCTCTCALASVVKTCCCRSGLHEASCPAFVAIPCGTPEEEREKAHAREREIAQRLEQAHLNGDGPGDDDAGDDDDDEGEMSGLGRQIARHAAKSHA